MDRSLNSRRSCPRPIVSRNHNTGTTYYAPPSIVGCWPQVHPIQFPTPSPSVPSVPPCGINGWYYWPVPCEPGPVQWINYGHVNNPYQATRLPVLNNHPNHMRQESQYHSGNLQIRADNHPYHMRQESQYHSENLQVRAGGNQTRTGLSCNFCRSNGERIEFYSSHNAIVGGIVRCPVLRKLICPHCGASGDNAHTRKYCPKRIQEESEAHASSGGDTDGGRAH